MRGDLLTIYLRDHHAAAAAGVALSRRLASASRAAADDDTAELEQLADEIAADRVALLDIMKAHGVEPSQGRIAIARLSEPVARLKLNGYFLHRSPLSKVVELEALGAGIHAKRDLWSTLERTMPDHAPPVGTLKDRASRQLTLVEGLRDQAAERAFAAQV